MRLPLRRRAAALTLLLLASCAGGDVDDRLLLDTARSTALLAWLQSGHAARDGHVVSVDRDGPCFAVRVRGNAPPPHETVLLRHPPADGARSLHGWQVVAIREGTFTEVRSSGERCTAS